MGPDSRRHRGVPRHWHTGTADGHGHRGSDGATHHPYGLLHGSVAELARRFELTGGFIKNAVLSALSIAVARQGSNAVVSQEDLLQGAKLQLRGRLQMRDFDRRVVPTQGLDELIVPDDVLGSLRDIVDFEKVGSALACMAMVTWRERQA